MIEIRPIRQDESVSFLRLLCDVFSLDFDRASSVFYTEPFFDLKRKWALFEHGMMCSILTTTPLQFGWGKAIGIAGVGTKESARCRGLARRLLTEVIDNARREGEEAALLFAHDPRLYAEVGFFELDSVIRGPLVTDPQRIPKPQLTHSAVRQIYDHWALQDQDRLRRDNQRWEFWHWSLRCCEPVDNGYICMEASVVREAVLEQNYSVWPTSTGTEWIGLQRFTEMLSVPITNPKKELIVMGLGFKRAPQMFMTDQF